MTALLASAKARNRRACRALSMSDKFALSDTMHFIEETRRVAALGWLERPAGRRFSRPFGRRSMDSGLWIAGPPT